MKWRSSRASLLWWLFCCLQLIGLFACWLFGILAMVVAADPTRITWIIFAVHVVATLAIGTRTLRANAEKLEPYWFVADMQMGLGLLGTLVGFVILLTGVFANFDPTNHEAVRTAIKFIAVGTGTALWTTLVGLSSALLIKTQLVSLEHRCGAAS